MFHYLPFCFAGSWIMLLTCLLRGSRLTLNTDLSKIAGDMRAVAPDYFLNVPALLERMRKAVDEQLWKTGGVVLSIYSRAKSAWVRKREGQASFADWIWLALANAVGSSDHPQEDDWLASESTHLRFSTAKLGDATLLPDAGDSGTAGLWLDRDYRHLHDGRSATRRAWAGRAGDPRD